MGMYHVILRKVFPMVLQHCEKVSQWFCYNVIAKESCNTVAGGFDCERVLQWFGFTVLREGVAMTLVYNRYNMFGSLG